MDRKAALSEYIKNEIMRNKKSHLDDNEDLLTSGILDSMAILQLVAYIEKGLGVYIPDEYVVYDHFRSVNSLVGLLQTLSPDNVNPGS